MGIFKNLIGKGGGSQRVDLKKRFERFGQVGQGSMSEVYKSRDRNNGQLVALKILDTEKTKTHAARFAKLDKPTEGEVACSLSHPHIVKTFEHGISTDDEEFLVMEYVDGRPLSYFVDTQNKVMQKKRIQLIVELGQAIDYFHSEGWIHRDICPRNILVDMNHQIKLIDFGLVVPNEPEFCQPGNRTGTAAYMAPELVRRQKTDQRIDVFSYAMTCYEMFTREFPWPGIQTVDTISQRINTPPHDIRELVPSIDEQVANAIMKGLEAEQNNRWQSVSAMLRQFTSSPPFVKATSQGKKKRTIKREEVIETEEPVLESDTAFDQFISEVTSEANADEPKKPPRKKVRKKKRSSNKKDAVKKKKKRKSSSKTKSSKRKRPPKP